MMLSIEALQYINYVFIFLVIVSVILLITLVFSKNSIKAINLFTVTMIGFISITVAALNLIFMGYAADELNYSTGHSVPLFGVLVVFSTINFFIVYNREWKLGRNANSNE